MFFYRCFYVQAKDLNSSIENGLPYELNVEIEKDYSELRTELNDVVDMIDKTNPKNVSQIFNKFCDRSTSLFEQYSIDFNIAELIQSFELLKWKHYKTRIFQLGIRYLKLILLIDSAVPEVFCSLRWC